MVHARLRHAKNRPRVAVDPPETRFVDARASHGANTCNSIWIYRVDYWKRESHSQSHRRACPGASVPRRLLNLNPCRKNHNTIKTSRLSLRCRADCCCVSHHLCHASCLPNRSLENSISRIVRLTFEAARNSQSVLKFTTAENSLRQRLTVRVLRQGLLLR